MVGRKEGKKGEEGRKERRREGGKQERRKNESLCPSQSAPGRSRLQPLPLWQGWHVRHFARPQLYTNCTSGHPSLGPSKLNGRKHCADRYAVAPLEIGFAKFRHAWQNHPNTFRHRLVSDSACVAPAMLRTELQIPRQTYGRSHGAKACVACHTWNPNACLPVLPKTQQLLRNFKVQTSLCVFFAFSSGRRSMVAAQGKGTL